MMSEPAMLSSLASVASSCDWRHRGQQGVFDGLDAQGTHSSAELAKRFARR